MREGAACSEFRRMADHGRRIKRQLPTLVTGGEGLRGNSDGRHQSARTSLQTPSLAGCSEKSVLAREYGTQPAEPEKHTPKNSLSGEASGKAEPPRSAHGAKAQLVGSYGCP